MDTSSLFNKMLDKAIESEPERFKGFDRTKNVQDQLQEIYQDSFGQLDKLSPFGLCQKILEFAGGTIISQDLMSMEQLWLAFVMKEKYNKIWNGEGWLLSEVISHSIL